MSSVGGNEGVNEMIFSMPLYFVIVRVYDYAILCFTAQVHMATYINHNKTERIIFTPHASVAYG